MSGGRISLSKTDLRRIGRAALGGLSEAEIRRDPEAAMKLAMGAMRGALGLPPPST